MWELIIKAGLLLCIQEHYTANMPINGNCWANMHEWGKMAGHGMFTFLFLKISQGDFGSSTAG